MEELRQALAPLNLNLYLSGCPLFVPNNKWLRLALNLYAFWLLVGHLYITIVLTSVGLPAETSILILLTVRVWETVYNGSANLTILIIWFSRHRLVQILERVSCFLRPENCRFLFRMSLVMILHTILCIALFRGYFFYVVLNREIEGMGHHEVYEFLNIIFNLLIVPHYWENTVLSLFLVTLTAVHLAERNALEKLQQNIVKISPKQLYKVLHRLLFIKKDFVNCISVLLFFLFSYFFIASVCFIVRIQALISDPSVPVENKTYSMISPTRLSVTVTEVVLLVFYTNYLSSKSRTTLDQIEYEINIKEDRLKERFIMKMIEASKKYEYRAADFFAINKELLLSFFSAFVTFTVLFVQLINQSK